MCKNFALRWQITVNQDAGTNDARRCLASAVVLLSVPFVPASQFIVRGCQTGVKIKGATPTKSVNRQTDHVQFLHDDQSARLF